MIPLLRPGPGMSQLPLRSHSGTAGRRRRLAPTIGAGTLLALVASAPMAAAPQQDPAGASARRVVAVADVHGAFDEFVAVLQVAGIVDENVAWAGGSATFVQTGDITDRGARVRDVMDLLMRLQQEAPAAGGEVVVILGNHEAMNLAGEHRDVNPESMEAFVEGDAEAIVREAYQEYERTTLRSQRDMSRLSARERRRMRDTFEEGHTAGRIAYARALGPEGPYGRWLRQQRVIYQVDGVTFLHAGISAEMEGWDVEQIAQRVGDEIEALDRYRAQLRQEERITDFASLGDLMRAASLQTEGWDWMAEVPAVVSEPPSLPPRGVPLVENARARFEPLYRLNDWYLLAPEGPLWYRGYSYWTDDEVEALLPTVLDRLETGTIVVGHTPQGRQVRARAQGRLLLIDTGMLTLVYGGRASAVVLQEGSVEAVYADGSRERLPGAGLVVSQRR